MNSNIAEEILKALELHFPEYSFGPFAQSVVEDVLERELDPIIEDLEYYKNLYYRLNN